MSETTSSSRPIQPSPVAGDPADARDDESASAASRPSPVADDQPTIISSRPPISPAEISESAHRILHGQIMPGDRLGHFELVEYVGGGGMGRVFRAVDTRLARTVALKILSADQGVDEETRLRFRNEAQSAARLDHESIARVHYVGEDRGLHYIVFEFIEGVNIRALVERKGPLPSAEAISYTLQVAEALAHAAARDVVHRDIKPSNVLVMPDGRVKLIDMGLARLRRFDASAADLTASGVTLGTFDYISPEQARDPRNADARSDIYSLGCTFFYMLAGRPPFPEGTVLQKLLQHQGDQPPDPRQFRPELPDEVTHVLRKMLAKDPRHRYRTPDELVDALLSLAEQVGLHPLGPGSRVLVVPHARQVTFLERHLPWIAPIVALVSIWAVLHVLWSEDPQPLPPVPPVVEPPGEPGHAPSTTPGTDPGSAPLIQEPAPAEGPKPVPSTPPGPAAVTPGEPGTAKAGPEGPGGLVPGGVRKPGPFHRAAADSSNGGAVTFDASVGGLSAGQATAHSLTAGNGNGQDVAMLTGANGPTPAAEAEPVAEPVPKRPGLLIVGDTAEGEGTYRSLGAACSAASGGDVIELRYHGRRDEQPIHLGDVKLTIRAGEDYHPVVVFRPGNIDPFTHAHSMLTVSAGRLKLVNVALELQVPGDVPAEGWSLLRIEGPQTVRLERCSLSVLGAAELGTTYHKGIALFAVGPAAGTDLVTDDDPKAAEQKTVIDLVDCIARGETDVIRVHGLQPTHFRCDNTLVATSGYLLVAAGGQQAALSGQMLQIDLHHVTAAARSGLCRLSGSYLSPHQLPLEVNCSDSILLGGGATLVEQVGIGDPDDLRRGIAWFGDRIFYENFALFWDLRDPEGEILAEPMDFDAWQMYWGTVDENLPLCDAVVWRQLPDADRPSHVHTPNDYALDASSESNPAIGAASDGRNAGVESARLPPLPAPPAAESEEEAEPSEESDAR